MKREVITKETCLSCGACCVAPHEQDSFCDVTMEDAERLGKKFVRLHVLGTSSLDLLTSIIDGRNTPPAAIKTRWLKARTGPFKGGQFNACAALRGSVMSRVHCSIYADRPHVCRVAVKPGDRVCRAIRRTFQKSVEDLKGSKVKR